MLNGEKHGYNLYIDFTPTPIEIIELPEIQEKINLLNKKYSNKFILQPADFNNSHWSNKKLWGDHVHMTIDGARLYSKMLKTKLRKLNII